MKVSELRSFFDKLDGEGFSAEDIICVWGKRLSDCEITVFDEYGKRIPTLLSPHLPPWAEAPEPEFPG